MDTRTPEYSEQWIGIAEALLQRTLPKGADESAFGVRLPPEAFSALVERSSQSVSHAFACMAEAQSEAEVLAIRDQLTADTLTAFFARWAQHLEHWRRFGVPPPTVPGTGPMWRNVLLALADGALVPTAHAPGRG